MKFIFEWGRNKQKPEPVKAPEQPPQQKRSHECAHDWTNWTDPIVTDVKSGVYIESEGEHVTVERLQQQRRCIKCNLNQRSWS